MALKTQSLLAHSTLFTWLMLSATPAAAQTGNGWWRAENWQPLAVDVQGTRSWNEFRVNPQGGYTETTHEAPLTGLPANLFGFNELRWNVTSRSRIDGTATLTLQWIGEGDPPQEIWTRAFSKATVGANIGNLTTWYLNNGLGALPEATSTFPWLMESQNELPMLIGVHYGLVTLRLSMIAEAHAVPSGPDPSPLVAAARLELPQLQIAHPAIVIGSSIEPNTTRGPGGDVIPTPIEDDRYKVGYTHIQKAMVGFPSMLQYFGEVDFLPAAEGYWHSQPSLEFSASDNPISITEMGETRRVRWIFSPPMIESLIRNNGTAVRTVSASALDKDGTGEWVAGSYEVRFKAPRSVQNAHPTVQVTLPYMQLRPVDVIPVNSSMSFQFINLHTMDVVNEIVQDSQPSVPFLPEFTLQLGNIYNRPMGAVAAITPFMTSSFTVINTSEVPQYFHAGRRHKIRTAEVDYATYGQTGYLGDEQVDLRLWRSPTAQAVGEFDFEDIVVVVEP